MSMFKFVITDPEGLQRKRKQNYTACEDCRKRKKRCDHSKSIEALVAGDEILDNAQDRSVQIGIVDVKSNTGLATASTKTKSAGKDDSQIEVAPSPVRAIHEPPFTQIFTNGLSLEKNVSASRTVPQPEEAALDLLSPESRRSQRFVQRFVGDLNPESVFISANLSTANNAASDLGDTGVWSIQHISGDTDHVEYRSTPLPGHSSGIFSFDPDLERLLLPSQEQHCLRTLPPVADMEALSNIYFQKVHPILPVVDKHSLETMKLSNAAAILLRQGIALAASASTAAIKHLHLDSSSRALSQKDFAQKISAAMRTSIYIGLISDKLVIIQAVVLLSLFMQTGDGGDMSAQMSGRAVHHIHSLGLHLNRRKSEQENLHDEPLFCAVWSLDRLNAAFHGRPVLMHERDIGRDIHECFKRQAPCFRLFLAIVDILDRIIQLYRPKTISVRPLPTDQLPDFEELLLDCGASREEPHLLATIETFYHAVCILSCRSSFYQTLVRSSPIHIRLCFSASRITSIVSQEFHGQLSLIPIVPYAVSLSLSVAYRELRHSKVPMYQRRARTQLQVNCNLLKELGNVFWSAAAMAEMGEHVLMEMDRVLSLKMEPYQQSRTKPQLNPQQANPQGTNMQNLLSSDMQAVVSEDNNDTNSTPLIFDSNSFDNISNLDIFDQFDSNFDLEAIDAALGGGHLDMSLPPDFGDFWQFQN